MMGKFESYFPEAFEQMGPIIFGHFLERKNRDGFTRSEALQSVPQQRSLPRVY